jgi:hypothetical protein
MLLELLFMAVTAHAACGPGFFGISPDLSKVAVSSGPSSTPSNPKTVFIYDLKSGAKIQLEPNYVPPSELIFLNESELLGVSTSEGTRFRKWNVADGSFKPFSSKIFTDSVGSSRTMISGSGHYATASSQRAFGGWGYISVDLFSQTFVYGTTFYSGAGVLSNDGKTLFVIQPDGSDYGLLDAVDLASGATIFETRIHRPSYYDKLAWLSNGHLLVIQNHVQEVNPVSGKIIKEYPFMGDPVAWTSDFTTALVVGGTGSVSLVHPGSSESSVNIDGIVNPSAVLRGAAQISRDLKTVAVVSDGFFSVHDAVTGKLVSGPTCVNPL